MADHSKKVSNTSNSSSTLKRGKDRPQTLRQILHGLKPPFSVKHVRGELDKYSPQHIADINTAQFTVMQIRRKKTVLARKMQWDRRSEDYVPTGSQLEIPAQYKGWFEVLPNDGRPVEYLDTIYGITLIKPRRFLVRTSTVGYHLTVEESGSSWTPFEVRPGEVLTSGIVYNDQRKQKAITNMKNLFKKLIRSGKFMRKDSDLRYLQCFDSTGKEIMIPLIMSGVFSPIGDITDTSYDSVYDLQDMLLAFTLPVKVQLVHGHPSEKQVVPNGVLRIEGAKDYEYAVIRIGAKANASESVFELPVDCDLLFVKTDMFENVKKTSTKESVGSHQKFEKDTCSISNETGYLSKEISLPVRVPNKENRKIKGSVLLEKLSTRKTKKERAQLKALQEEGVFSSRLNKPDAMMDDLLDTDGADTVDQGQSVEQEVVKPIIPKVQDPTQQADVSYATVVRREKSGPSAERPRSIQERTLPPIPKTSDTSFDTNEFKERCEINATVPTLCDFQQSPRAQSDLDDSSETLYEKLPPAPQPPDVTSHATVNSASFAAGLSEEDGYLVPKRTKCLSSEVASQIDIHGVPGKHSNFANKTRNPVTHRANNEYGQLGYRADSSNRSSSLDIDELFDFATEGHDIYRQSPKQQYSRNCYRSYTPNNQCYGALRDSNLSRSRHNISTMSLSQRNLPLDGNATLRRHNIKKLQTARELFDTDGSTLNIRDELASKIEPSESRYHLLPSNDNLTSINQSYFTGRDSGIGGMNYAGSEPGFRQYNRSFSVTGLSDSYVKHGDDSAISLCSKGDYGYNVDSEYSYSEHPYHLDDGWVPPEDLQSLSVLEVSKSLRYIGMKDRVVLRFSQEQIDGDMLCSLNHSLLQEGFPELNRFEIKKILDFLDGWRPKK